MKNTPYIHERGSIDEEISGKILTNPPSIFPGVYIRLDLDLNISLIGKSYIEEEYELKN